MTTPALLASIREDPLLRWSTSNTVSPGTMRVLIRVTGASALLPATARLTITGGSGEPVAEVTLAWGNVSDDEAGLRAILEALKIVGRYRARRVVIYIDNAGAASIAAGDEKAPAALVGLALQLRALSHTYRSVEIRHGISLVAPTLPDLHEFAPA